MDFTSDERNYLDTHSYKIEQLWECAKNKPIINLPISAFNNSLSSKYWDDKEGNDISPYEVLANPKKAPYHIEAINKADLNYRNFSIQNFANDEHYIHREHGSTK